jgi:hypothetical protein
MLAERATHWNVGMLECFGSLAHAEPVHDRTGPAIVNCREGNDVGQTEQLEADPKCTVRSLCSVALVPMSKREAPANLDARRKRKLRCRSVQANKPYELAAFLDFDSPEASPALRDQRLDALSHCITCGSCKGAGKKLHDSRISV